MLQNMLQRRFVRNGRRTGLNVASHNIMCGTHRAMRELSKVASFCCDKKKLQGCSVHYGHCTDLNTTPHNIMCKTRCRHARHQGTRSKQLHDDDDDDNEDTDDKLQACGQEKLKCDQKPRMLDIRGKSHRPECEMAQHSVSDDVQAIREVWQKKSAHSQQKINAGGGRKLQLVQYLSELS